LVLTGNNHFTRAEAGEVGRDRPLPRARL